MDDLLGKWDSENEFYYPTKKIHNDDSDSSVDVSDENYHQHDESPVKNICRGRKLRDNISSSDSSSSTCEPSDSGHQPGWKHKLTMRIAQIKEG